jgi:hypothetical protein
MFEVIKQIRFVTLSTRTINVRISYLSIYPATLTFYLLTLQGVPNDPSIILETIKEFLNTKTQHVWWCVYIYFVHPVLHRRQSPIHTTKLDLYCSVHFTALWFWHCRGFWSIALSSSCVMYLTYIRIHLWLNCLFFIVKFHVSLSLNLFRL